MTRPIGVLFVCTHNSARSQMAEGLLRAWAGNRFDVSSAGTEAGTLRPEAVEVMREIGVDIAEHESKDLAGFIGRPFDWLVTVCDGAREACPVMPGIGNQEHWSIEDPSSATGDHEARIAAFRAARDDLAERIRGFIERNAAEG